MSDFSTRGIGVVEVATGRRVESGYGNEAMTRCPSGPLDFVAGVKDVVGNIVGTYTDLAELMVLAQAGYPLP